jgi:hypothetical protein
MQPVEHDLSKELYGADADGYGGFTGNYPSYQERIHRSHYAPTYSFDDQYKILIHVDN